ncbi:MAG: hypothetical protein R6X10_15070 [Desulfobacterales bacterium]
MHLLLRLVLFFMIFGLCDPAVLKAAAAGAETESVFPPVTLKELKPEISQPSERIHPPIRLLDQNGLPVVESQEPVACMQTCGHCHDTTYIAENNYHAQAGLNEIGAASRINSGRSWDISPGLFGRWNPLTYRVLSNEESEKLDMGTADWIMTMGPRHVGGGPAENSRYQNKRLDELLPSEIQPFDSLILDSGDGRSKPWDWKQSGIVELNCFICHMEKPNNIERVEMIRSGRFRWASSATLKDTGLVSLDKNTLKWMPDKFQKDGTVKADVLGISDPKSANCRLCHAKSCRCTDPVVFHNSLENWAAETTGEVFSSEKIFASGMNQKNKNRLFRPWDIHAQRLFECVHCHPAMNNPRYSDTEKPGHLRFDARRLNENEYLIKPDHNFAKGHTAQGTVARRLDGTMRDCRDCHQAEAVHDFLPYKRLHFEKLNCQVCHIPEVFAPARSVTDWTVITLLGNPRVEHRGVQGKVNDPASVIIGYEPALLFHETSDGRYRLAPNNLIVSWFWTEGNPRRPVRLLDLKTAYLTAEGHYHPDIVSALDSNKDGRLSLQELRLDTEAKVRTVSERLKKTGINNPRIQGEIQPYTHSHGVASRNFAMKDCRTCHSRTSRVNQAIPMAEFVPGSILPESVADSKTKMIGVIQTTQEGALVFKPGLDPSELYLHGTLRPQWLDIIGMIIVILSIIGVVLHGGLRMLRIGQKNKRSTS